MHEITELAVDYPKLSVHRRWLAIPFGWLCKLFAQTLIQGVNERYDTWWAILVYVGFSFSLTLGVHKRFELFARIFPYSGLPYFPRKLLSVQSTIDLLQKRRYLRCGFLEFGLIVRGRTGGLQYRAY